MNSKALKLLLAGEYLCSVRFPNEFELLNDENEREQINSWLQGLGNRLTRIGDEGAFFMAPEFIGAKEMTQVKNELLKFRDEYGPAVTLLDFIRQVKVENVLLSPGEYIQLYELDSAVSQNSTLEAMLKTLLPVIFNGAQRNTNHENLSRLMQHLAKDGYLVLANKDTGAYQVTGKIEQLYAVLQFLDESQVIHDGEFNVQEEIQADLIDETNFDAEDSGVDSFLEPVTKDSK